MLYDSEHDLFRAIGGFSTVAQVSITGNNYSQAGYISDSYSLSFYGNIASQCAALLVTNQVFTLFIESWTIDRSSGNPVFIDKKIYPAKVTGLGIPYPMTQTFRWREGLIDNNFSRLESFEEYRSFFRPGFGQNILSDLERPFISASVVGNNLGLNINSDLNNYGFAGPLGRLMSMAFWVDPDLAKQYDDSKNKKKKKAPNEQDYQQMPEYPPYTPYQDNSGY